ncbi:MAG: hypothetical protein AAFW73_22560 [Bacteroidota bacterium]
MKRISLLGSLLLLLPWYYAVGQNQVPQISNVKVTIDDSAKRLDLTYDLADAEETEATVYFSISDDGGRRFMVPTDNAEGDLGAAVAMGTGKHIHWDYAALDLDLAKLHFRLVADDGYDIPMAELLAKVDTNRLRSLGQQITIHRHHNDEAGLTKLERVRSIIEEEFSAVGLDLRRQEVFFGSFSGQNVLARKGGMVKEASNFVVMSSFDSVPSRPGNVINSSGMVGVLEAMRILAEYDFAHSIRGNAYDMSYPEYRGSNFFVWEESGLPADETIGGAIYLDGIGSDQYEAQRMPEELLAYLPGWPQQDYQGSFVFNFANERSYPLFQMFNQAAQENVPGLQISGLPVPGHGEDAYVLQSGDHAPFWYHHYPALKVTTYMGMRPLPIPEDKTPSEAFLELNSVVAIADIVKATIATVAKGAQIMHCVRYEAPVVNEIN